MGSIWGKVTPPGVPPPDDPFPEDAGLFLTVDDNLKVTSQQIIPAQAHPIANAKSFQTFDNGRSSQEWAEQTWAFKARRLAYALALCTACANDLQDTVEPLSKNDWQRKIGILQGQLVTAEKGAAELCTTVATTITKT